MKIILSVMAVILCSCSGAKHSGTVKNSDGWISLFDGKSLNGWKVGDNAASFWVENGSIAVNG